MSRLSELYPRIIERYGREDGTLEFDWIWLGRELRSLMACLDDTERARSVRAVTKMDAEAGVDAEGAATAILRHFLERDDEERALWYMNIEYTRYVSWRTRDGGRAYLPCGRCGSLITFAWSPGVSRAGGAVKMHGVCEKCAGNAGPLTF